MVNKHLNTILVSLGILTILLVLASQVRSTGVATGSYYLDTPLPIASFYIGQYSNSTYFAVNGSNWQNFLRSDNASYVDLMVNGNVSSGGKVIYGEGSYNFTIVKHLKENVTYSGVNRETVIWQVFTSVANYRGGVENENWADTSGSVWDSNIVVEHLTIDGMNESQSNAAPSIICLRNAEDVLFFDVRVTNGKRDGIRGANDENYGIYTRNVHIVECYIDRIRSCGIQPVGHDGEPGNSSENWIVRGCSVTKCDVGIGFYGAYGGLIQDNHVYACTLDSSINDRDHIAISLEDYTNNVLVEGNLIDGRWETGSMNDNGTSGIAIMSNSFRNRISNNVLMRLNMTNSPHSWIGIGSGCDENQVNDNSIIVNGDFNAVALGIRCHTSSENNTFINNYFFNCSEGIRTNARLQTITGNQFFECATGLLMQGGSDNCTITLNVFRACGTAIDLANTFNWVAFNDLQRNTDDVGGQGTDTIWTDNLDRVGTFHESSVPDV